MTLQIDDVIATFDMLDAWEDRYRYLIEMGRSLEPLAQDERNETNRVRGCASQVWVVTTREQQADGSVRLHLRGDSDAHIVKGLVALVLSFYDHKSPQQVLDSDVMGLFRQLGLSEHLTPQRSNGVRSMVERIRHDASLALAQS